MKPMDLHDMYPGAFGTLQYSEGHVKIAAFAKNVQDLYALNTLSMGQKDRRVSSTFKFSLPFAVQQHFTNLENFEGKECVQVLDKHSGLKVLLLNLEMVSVIYFCPSCSAATTARATRDTRSEQEKGKYKANYAAKSCGEHAFFNPKCQNCSRTYCTSRGWRDSNSGELHW